MAVLLPGDVTGEVVGKLGPERTSIVQIGDPLARVVGEGAGYDVYTGDVGLDIARGGVGIRCERVAIRIPTRLSRPAPS